MGRALSFVGRAENIRLAIPIMFQELFTVAYLGESWLFYFLAMELDISGVNSFKWEFAAPHSRVTSFYDLMFYTFGSAEVSTSSVKEQTQVGMKRYKVI